MKTNNKIYLILFLIIIFFAFFLCKNVITEGYNCGDSDCVYPDVCNSAKDHFGKKSYWCKKYDPNEFKKKEQLRLALQYGNFRKK